MPSMAPRSLKLDSTKRRIRSQWNVVGNSVVRSDTCRMETFGSRLKAARLARGMTQEQLAHEIGVSSPAVSQWERDGSEPNFMSLRALSEVLDVTLDALIIGGADSRTTSERLAAKERALIDRFRALSAQERQAVLRLLKL